MSKFITFVKCIILKENDESARFRSSRLLACLPQNELSPAQRTLAGERIQEGFHLIRHPKKRFRGGSFSVGADSDFYAERAKGWPTEFDPDELRILSQAEHALSGSEVKEEIIREQLPKAAAAAGHLLPAIEANLAVIQDPHKFWILDALESVLEKYQRLKEKGTEVQPSSSLVERCANIAVTILESTPYEISDGELEQHGGRDVWFPPETLWRHALALADATLVWPPASSDQAIQDRFDRAHNRELHVITIATDVENRISQGIVDQLRFELSVHQNTVGGVCGVRGKLACLERVCRS